ncbi:MBL fold metallo-hydrolase [Oricola cellulosilytica]|uniref:MBL fold metallo-hydrolase n=2 Tax=Oricola cellulosilytica TaxID=1429082 RepID=A0A4V2MPV6_9HYPH|nr:MBL fold metallo-hydrolase [Oricola cellulosilytica]
MPTSSLVEMAGLQIVVDCGLGVTRALAEQGVRLPDLRTIVITHLHSDHYLELGPLLHTAWTAGLKDRVAVYGPAALAEYWRHFLASMAFDIETRIADEGRPDLVRLVDIRAMGEGVFMTSGAVVGAGLLNRHPPVTESYALSFAADGRKVVFSGDTAPFEGFSEFAAGADLLVHEAMHEDGVDRLVARVGNGRRLREHLVASHTPAAEAGRIATKAGVKRLALHHLVPSDDPQIGPADWEESVRATWDGPLFIGTDGLRIDLS